MSRKTSVFTSFSYLPTVYSREEFDKLPNKGVFSLKYVPEQPLKPVPVSAAWRQTQKYHPQKRKTTDFLRETVLYIENIRKPQIIDFKDCGITPKIGKKLGKVKVNERKETERVAGPSYSVKYIGSWDGKLTVLTTRLPIQGKERKSWMSRRIQTETSRESGEMTRISTARGDLDVGRQSTVNLDGRLPTRRRLKDLCKYSLCNGSRSPGFHDLRSLSPQAGPDFAPCVQTSPLCAVCSRAFESVFRGVEV